MKVIKKLKLVFIIIIMIVTFSSSSSYAQLEKYLYKNSDNKYNYILTQKVKSESGARSHLHEVFTNSVAEFFDKIHGITNIDIDEIKELINGKAEPHIKVKRYTLEAKEKGLGTDSYYYFWLEGVVKMVNYTRKDDIKYTSFGNEKNDDIITAIAVLEACDTDLGTFATETNKLPSVMNEISDWVLKPDTNRLSQKRSAYAYGVITGTGKKYQKTQNNVVKDEFQKKCQEAKRELKAAYDYNNKTTKYGDNIWDDFDTKSKYSAVKIQKYWTDYGKRYNVGSRGEELEKIWEQIVGKNADETIEDWDGNADAADPAADDASEPAKVDPDVSETFYMPENETADRTSNPSGVVEDAEAFVTTDSNNPYEQSYLKTENLQEFSQTLYSVLLGIGIVLAVIIGLILGIKFMLSSVTEKAQVKKLLVTYAIGCVVVFGAFGIWKIVVEIMKNI